MKIPKLGKKKDEGAVNEKANKPSKKNSLGLKHRFEHVLKLIMRFQVPVIALLVVCLLAVTALRMLSYSNPSPDEEKIQENLGKFKKIHIDPKIVDKINQLSDSQASTSTRVEDSRNNPFSE